MRLDPRDLIITLHTMNIFLSVWDNVLTKIKSTTIISVLSNLFGIGRDMNWRNQKVLRFSLPTPVKLIPLFQPFNY